MPRFSKLSIALLFLLLAPFLLWISLQAQGFREPLVLKPEEEKKKYKGLINE
jgi:hypothetical protein